MCNTWLQAAEIFDFKVQTRARTLDYFLEKIRHLPEYADKWEIADRIQRLQESKTT